MKSRRYFLSLAAAPVALHAAPASAARETPDPPGVGLKFARNGRVLPFPGNTIICHLPQQGEGTAFFNALLDAYRETPAHGFVRKVTLVPPSSYHMTIFSAADHANREPGLWPAGLPSDAPISTCNRFVAERLADFQLQAALPIRVCVNLDEPENDERPLRLRLRPANAVEDRKVRTLRDRLSAHLKIRAPGHERYEFHVTLGYLIEWLSGAEQMEFRAALRRWREAVFARSPVIELGAPEYCTFEDMFAYHRQFYLT